MRARYILIEARVPDSQDTMILIRGTYPNSAHSSNRLNIAETTIPDVQGTRAVNTMWTSSNELKESPPSKPISSVSAATHLNFVQRPTLYAHSGFL